MSESKELEKLKNENNELHVSLSENRNLIRLISHDLNNYLSIILSSSNLLGEYIKQNNSKKVEEHLDKINRSVENQGNLIHQILEIESYHSCGKDLNIRPVQIAKVLDIMTFAFEDRLEYKDIKVDITYNCPKNQSFLVDLVPFSNSVVNVVVSNAIKFTPKGGTVNIEINRDEKEGVLQITVKDKGVGIPDDILKSIFVLQEKSSRRGTEGEKGIGFGMPLLKSYIEKMNGTIDIQTVCQNRDPVNHGTTVIIKAPLAPE